MICAIFSAMDCVVQQIPQNSVPFGGKVVFVPAIFDSFPAKWDLFAAQQYCYHVQHTCFEAIRSYAES